MKRVREGGGVKEKGRKYRGMKVGGGYDKELGIETKQEGRKMKRKGHRRKEKTRRIRKWNRRRKERGGEERRGEGRRYRTL